MRISQLIVCLEAYKKQEGDLRVFLDTITESEIDIKGLDLRSDEDLKYLTIVGV